MNIKKIELDAVLENFEDFLGFIESTLDEYLISNSYKMKILIVCEEIIVNICNYAYSEHNEMENKYLSIKISYYDSVLKIVFTDQGSFFNPLDYNNDERSLTPEEKNIGGLGIIMVKEFVDKISYNFTGKKNILTIEKKIEE